MPVINAHPPGSFCWIELATTDAADARRFYGGLFGWEFDDNPIGPGMVYTTLRIGSRSLGAMYQINEADQAGGGPLRWLPYVSVADLQGVVDQAVSLGASVLRGPAALNGLARTAWIRDPEGALLALWQPGTHQGAGIANEPGAMTWHELASRDPVKATNFYASVFGWTPRMVVYEETGVYTELVNGAVPVGGILAMPEAWGGVPAMWMAFFAVRGCDAAIDQAITLGASLEYGPLDIPDIGRYAVLADPQCALLAIVQQGYISG